MGVSPTPVSVARQGSRWAAGPYNPLRERRIGGADNPIGGGGTSEDGDGILVAGCRACQTRGGAAGRVADVRQSVAPDLVFVPQPRVGGLLVYARFAGAGGDRVDHRPDRVPDHG